MTPKEFLESKGIWGLDTKKRTNEVYQWMKEYAEYRVKNCNTPAVSGQACKCGNQTFTHRHTNWIECTECNLIKVLQA